MSHDPVDAPVQLNSLMVVSIERAMEKLILQIPAPHVRYPVR